MSEPRDDMLYPRLDRLIRSASALIMTDVARRDDLSVRLRFYAGRCHYYGAKVRHIARRSTSEQINWLLRQARKPLKRLASPRPAHTRTRVDPREWRWAVLTLMRYSPDWYPGRVDLFWGGGEERDHIDGQVTEWQSATEQWRRVARDVRVHVIPGTHGRVITTQIDALAARLQACLRETSAR